jgi:CRISPR-associated protein Cmr4
MHVGAGELNFNIIDKQVQRDFITKIPMINSSSLKGALREHFTESNMTNFIFGTQTVSDERSVEGAYRFFDAHLLTRPIRSSQKAYFIATSPAIIKNFLEKIELFDIKIDSQLKDELIILSKLNPKEKAVVFEDIEGLILEDIQTVFNSQTFKYLFEFLGNNLALLSDDDFKNLELPVVARNKLDNGKSENLWYEEIVPRESVFYFFITKPTNLDSIDEIEKLLKYERSFERTLMEDYIQFGANKSIGYGISKVTKV